MREDGDGHLTVLQHSRLVEYLPQLSTGILYRGSAYAPRAFTSGFQNVVVTYRAGYLNSPKVVRKVALNLVQNSWQSSQQAPHPALSEFSGEQDVFTAVSQLSPIEQRAYDSLRAVGVA